MLNSITILELERLKKKKDSSSADALVSPDEFQVTLLQQ